MIGTSGEGPALVGVHRRMAGNGKRPHFPVESSASQREEGGVAFCGVAAIEED